MSNFTIKLNAARLKLHKNQWYGSRSRNLSIRYFTYFTLYSLSIIVWLVVFGSGGSSVASVTSLAFGYALTKMPAQLFNNSMTQMDKIRFLLKIMAQF